MTGSNSPSDGVRRSVALHRAEGEFARLMGFAEDFARCCGLPDPERSRLLVILEELFTNSLRYWYPADMPGHIEVVLATGPGRIEIDYSDDGQPFDPLAPRVECLDGGSTARPEGGLGLKIVRGLVDEAHYRRERGRNCLALVRRLAPPR